MKKFLAVLLSLVMAFTLMMPTFAADEKIDALENRMTELCSKVYAKNIF